MIFAEFSQSPVTVVAIFAGFAQSLTYTELSERGILPANFSMCVDFLCLPHETGRFSLRFVEVTVAWVRKWGSAASDDWSSLLSGRRYSDKRTVREVGNVSGSGSEERGIWRSAITSLLCMWNF